MAEFAQHCPFPAPRPIGYGRPGARYPMPWSVQTWIVGEVATPQGLARSHMFALDLVTLITTLRAVDAGDRSYSGSAEAATSGITMTGWPCASRKASACSTSRACAHYGRGFATCRRVDPT